MRMPLTSPQAFGCRLVVAWMTAAALFACSADDATSDAALPAPLDAGPPPTRRDVAPPDFGAPTDGPITTGPELEVSLEVVELGADPGETSAPALIRLRNFGTSDLTLTRLVAMSIDAPGAFRLENAPGLPLAIAPGEALELQMTYTASATAQVEGTLDIESDDADEPRVEVPLLGRPPVACAELTPGAINLGQVEVGQASGRAGATLRNCGERALTLDTLRFEGDPGFGALRQDDTEVAPAFLAPNERLEFDVFYQNVALGPDAIATARLLAVTSLGEARSPAATLSVRGGAGAGCVLTPTSARMEFGYLRIGLTQRLTLAVTNEGNDRCTLRATSVEAVDGPPQNTFSLVTPPAMDTLGAGESATVEVEFAPTVVSPGDRAALHFDYRDERAAENRRTTVNVFGVGTEALIEVSPVDVDFGRAQAPECAGAERDIMAANANLVPLCVTAWRLEGEDCEAFVPVSAPDAAALAAGCVPLAPRESTRWRFRHEPHRAGPLACALVVESDAMNTPVARTTLRAEGTVDAAQTDTFETPNLGANDGARFTLSRPALEEGMRVLIRDQVDDRWRFDAPSNQVRWAANAGPVHRELVRVSYEAACLPRSVAAP